MNLQLFQFGIVSLAIFLWESGVRLGIIDPFYLSSPSKVGMTLFTWIQKPTFWNHLWLTSSETAVGFFTGLCSGIAFGFGLAANPKLDAVLQPFLVFTNALPRISFAPLIILWFGFGFTSKVVIVWSLVFFVVLFNVYGGFKNVAPILLKHVRVLGATRWQTFRYIYWPASLSWVFASLRVVVGFAVAGAVLGEYIGSSGGIGYLIDNAQANFDSTGVIAGLVVLTFIVLLVDTVVKKIEIKTCIWRNPDATFRKVTS